MERRRLIQNGLFLLGAASLRPFQIALDELVAGSAAGLEERLTIKPGLNSREFLSAFLRAPSGTLMAYYQWYWPHLLTGVNPTEIVDQVKSACAQHSRLLRSHQQASFVEDNDPLFVELLANRAHFLRALVPVTALHSLAYCQLDEHRSLLDEVRSSIADALETEPNREVLEIIWQNATTALIANERSYRDFPSGHLVDSAVATIEAFLLSEGTVLLLAATCALHFLIAAAAAARVAERPLDTRQLQAAITRSLRADQPNSVWLRPFAQHIKPDANLFVCALPQQSEIIMGPRELWPDAWDAVVYTRLRAIYTNHMVAERIVESPFMSDLNRASVLPRSMALWLRLHGFNEERWRSIRGSAARLELPDDPDLVDYIDKELLRMQGGEGTQLDLEKRHNPLLGAMVPFRDHGEALLAKQIVSNPEQLISVIAAEGFPRLRRQIADESAHSSLTRLPPDQVSGLWESRRDAELQKIDHALSNESDEYREVARHIVRTHVDVPASVGLFTVLRGRATSERPSSLFTREMEAQSTPQDGDSGSFQRRSDAVSTALSSLDPPAPTRSLLHDDDAIEHHEDLFLEVTVGHPAGVVEDVRSFLHGDMSALRPPAVQRGADGFVINPDLTYGAAICRIARKYIEAVEFRRKTNAD